MKRFIVGALIIFFPTTTFFLTKSIYEPDVWLCRGEVGRNHPDKCSADSFGSFQSTFLCTQAAEALCYMEKAEGFLHKNTRSFICVENERPNLMVTCDRERVVQTWLRKDGSSWPTLEPQVRFWGNIQDVLEGVLEDGKSGEFASSLSYCYRDKKQGAKLCCPDVNVPGRFECN